MCAIVRRDSRASIARLTSMSVRPIRVQTVELVLTVRTPSNAFVRAGSSGRAVCQMWTNALLIRVLTAERVKMTTTHTFVTVRAASVVRDVSAKLTNVPPIRVVITVSVSIWRRNTNAFVRQVIELHFHCVLSIHLFVVLRVYGTIL